MRATWRTRERPTEKNIGDALALAADADQLIS